MLPPICHSRDTHPAISLVDAGELVFLPNEFKPEGGWRCGYRTPVVLAIIAEGATILLLTPVLATSLAGAFYRRSESSAEQDGSLGRRVVVLRTGK
jgi:hypothetical protein